MKLVSYGEAVKKRAVTGSPEAAGLVAYTVDDLKGGKASGLVCGGGPSSVVWCTPPGKHAVIVGRTGSGKTRSCLEPTVVANGTHRGGHRPKSMMIVDSKRTMWRETAPYMLSQGYEVKVVDLMAARSEGRWNPLSEAYGFVSSAGDVAAAERSISNLKAAAIASVRSERDKYWENVAWEGVSSVALALCMMGDTEPTLADVRDTIYSDTALRKVKARLGKRTPRGVLACIDLSEVERTWSCVKSTVDAMLSFYATDSGRHVSGESNIDFKSELFGQKPMCYYVISPDTNVLCGGYTVQLIESATRSYMEEFESRGLEGTDMYGLMLVIDEFARLPRCEQILSLMATGRSRNVTAYLAIQSFSQFLERGLYTRDEANVVLEQAAVNVYFSNTSAEVAKDAGFKSGGVVGTRQMLQMELGDAYVCVAGKPMVGMHMEPLRAYVPVLGIPEFPLLHRRVVHRLRRDDVVERVLDLAKEDELVGIDWGMGEEELLDVLLAAFRKGEDRESSDSGPDIVVQTLEGKGRTEAEDGKHV